MTQVVNFEGVAHNFPDDATAEEIRKALQDHVPAAKAKPSLLDKALEPFTTWPETYSRMRGESEDQMSRGTGQIAHPDSLTDPKAHGISDVLSGIGNVAAGAINFVASPASAAIHTIAGKPPATSAHEA